jgi:hypothetical protein
VVIANHFRIPRPLIHYSNNNNNNNNNNLKKTKQNKLKENKNKKYSLSLSLSRGRVCGAWRRIWGAFSILRERAREREIAPKPIWVSLISSELLSGCFRNTASKFLILIFLFWG